MSETLIKVENVSKKFCRSLKRSLWYGMRDLGRELTARSHGGNGELRPAEFWAVKDAHFEVRRGECLGLIGHNGAGKTTLLRMLNGLIKPDSGRIEVRGRVGALIALGAGFNPILTGKENVYAAGAVLGLTTRDITKKYDAIVDFAELQEFMDSPVQTYSSGMQVRLGFAVAANMNPDILLLDEVLAVGDARFQVKCVNSIRSLQNSGAAVILVSHNMVSLMQFTTICALLKKGTIIGIGPFQEITSLYYQTDQTNLTHEQPGNVESDSGICLSHIRITDSTGSDLTVLPSQEPIFLHIPYKTTKPIDPTGVKMQLGIDDSTGVYYQGLSETLQFSPTRYATHGEFVARIHALMATSGTINIGVAMWSSKTGEMLAWTRNNVFAVRDTALNAGRVSLNLEWTIHQIH